MLAACAGVGAFVASRSNPFPPGVDDPGALPTSSTPSGKPTETWAGSGVVRSAHRLFVGGSCRTSWRVQLSVEVGDGAVQGSGTARLEGGAACDFATAQLQARRVRFDVTGGDLGAALRLGFQKVSRRPAGSIDLGGLVPLLERTRLDLDVEGGSATGLFERVAPDGDRGMYEARGRITLTRQA